MQENFASDGAATLADQLCRRDLEDGTLQNLLDRDASEQRAGGSLSHLRLPEEVSNALTFIPVRNCDDMCFVPLLSFQARRLAYTYSIHLPGSIVFLTVGFLFPVLAEHTPPLTRTWCQSSPASPWAVCACSWRCVSSTLAQSLVLRLVRWELLLYVEGRRGIGCS